MANAFVCARISTHCLSLQFSAAAGVAAVIAAAALISLTLV